MFLIFFLSIFIANSVGQIPLYKKPNITSMLNLNKSQITGPWFEISRIPNAFEIDDKCSILTYELNEKLGSFNLSLDAVKSRTGIKHNSSVAAFPKKNGAFILRYLIVPPIYLGTYYILDTDYTNYLVAAAVTSDSERSFVFAWIKSRRQTISSEDYESAVEALKTNNIPHDALKLVTQDCSTSPGQ
ncbi:apolipoprotein D-like [Aphidius gifuensis]|uniref:apolipoprotein D-like n=1 Tax=Aphidius gifuensis TaxID=684658 RepID=UPI001CDC41BF|nr:apolipoprotein D-like [Aphidius gifuensis]